MKEVEGFAFHLFSEQDNTTFAANTLHLRSFWC